jgi:hypothetical protein
VVSPFLQNTDIEKSLKDILLLVEALQPMSEEKAFTRD